MKCEPKRVHYSLNLKLYKQDKFFGPGVVQLLHTVDETASLRTAAAQMKMAYSKAWKMISRAEKNLGYALLITKTGGKHGGGAQLTLEAKALLTKFMAFETSVYRSAEEMWAKYFPEYIEEGSRDQHVEAAVSEKSQSKVAAILLASGYSRRMGYNKLLLSLGEKTVAEYILDQIHRQNYTAVAVISQYPEILEMARQRGFLSAINLEANEGKSSSIRTGLNTLSALPDIQGVIFFTGDQILLSDQLLMKLQQTFEQNPDKIVFPEYDGELGAPAIFPADLIPELLMLKEEEGGRFVAEKHPQRILAMAAQPSWQGLDFDRPEDWEKVRQLWIYRK